MLAADIIVTKSLGLVLGSIKQRLTHGIVVPSSERLTRLSIDNSVRPTIQYKRMIIRSMSQDSIEIACQSVQVNTHRFQSDQTHLSLPADDRPEQQDGIGGDVNIK